MMAPIAAPIVRLMCDHLQLVGPLSREQPTCLADFPTIWGEQRLGADTFELEILNPSSGTCARAAHVCARGWPAERHAE